MSNLTPSQIFNGYKNGELDKSSAKEYLISFVENSADWPIRVEALEFLGEMGLNDLSFFKFLEELIVSGLLVGEITLLAINLIANMPFKKCEEVLWFAYKYEEGSIKGRVAELLIEKNPEAAYEPIKQAFKLDEDHLQYDTTAKYLDYGTSQFLRYIANVLFNSSNEKYRALLYPFDYVLYKGEVILVLNGELDLKFKQIDNIDNIHGLRDLVDLKILDLSCNDITEIKGLESLTNLEILSLDDNKISEIKGLDTLTKLRVLVLFGNKISEIKNLNSLIGLERLALSRNLITEVSGLDTLKKLKFLSLYYNPIKEIKNPELLKRIKEVRLSKKFIL